MVLWFSQLRKIRPWGGCLDRSPDRHAKYPLEGKVMGETKTITVPDYSSGLQALGSANMCDRSYDDFVNYRFWGTEGSVELSR